MLTKYVGLLGVPSDLGANRDGSRYGAKIAKEHVIKALDKIKVKYKDFGNIFVPKALHIDEGKRRHYTTIKALGRAYKVKRKWNIDKCFPIIFGGDHSITMFNLMEMSKYRKIGLLYFDSHGDFNTPQITPSGNIHGMVVSRIVGRCLMDLLPDRQKFCREDTVVLMGTRNLDKEEKQLLKKSKVTVINMKDIKRMGCKKAMMKALKIVNKGTDGFHLSIDLDVVDPKFAPAVSTPVKGGFSKKDLLKIMKMCHDSNVLSADFVEYIPKEDKKCLTAKTIAEAVVTLIGY